VCDDLAGLDGVALVDIDRDDPTVSRSGSIRPGATMIDGVPTLVLAEATGP
jgi:hypothetical protein